MIFIYWHKNFIIPRVGLSGKSPWLKFRWARPSWDILFVGSGSNSQFRVPWICRENPRDPWVSKKKISREKFHSGTVRVLFFSFVCLSFMFCWYSTKIPLSLQTAFRVKAKEFHPDHNQDNKGKIWSIMMENLVIWCYLNGVNI